MANIKGGPTEHLSESMTNMTEHLSESMTNITDCKSISQKNKDKMFQLINMTTNTGKEHGAKLCQKNDQIILSRHCIGSKCAITMREFTKSICPKNTKEIGEFHTHPGTDYKPSLDDVANSLIANYKLFCIGADLQVDKSQGYYHKVVHCYDVKDEKLKKLGKELQETKDIDERSKIIKSIDNRLSYRIIA